MAILSTAKVVGMLVSAKKTGKQILNAAGEYVAEVVEDFVSGFMGHGWRIWEYVKGLWRLEIDSIVVRGTMTVFELLIQKIRAVKGALGITQACGKIKTANLDTGGENWLITIEDEMSFVAHDIIRCQNWTGNGIKGYWVEISEIRKIDGVDTIVIPVSEFTGGIGYVEGMEAVKPDLSGMTTPAEGDEIIQFGNSQNTNRQSAIYLHADEGGQPAIDILFGINSKSFYGCVKMRVGGDIPGADGLKGFYCENGMIKGTDISGHTVYCIHPNGSAEFGDGSAKFNTDKSGSIAGGAISWVWNADEDKFITSLGNVVIKWENLDDEVKENLKGESGIGIKETDVEYAISTSNTISPTIGWQTTSPVWVDGKYIWSRTKIVYTDASVKYTSAVCITGGKGASGDEGKGISSIVEQYYLSSSSSSLIGGVWGTQRPAWKNGWYIWTRSVITYTDDTSTTTEAICVTGEKGSDGIGISSSDVEYAKSSSSTVAPTAGWQTTAPTWENGKYIWSRTKIVYTDDSVKYTSAVCITGGKGASGDNGKGIQSIIEQYYLSSSSSSLIGGGWQNTSPAWKDGWYIWTRSVITYTDNTNTTTEAICVTGGKGADGQDAVIFAIEFYMNGIQVQNIPCDIHFKPIGGNILTARLYRISGDSKNLFSASKWIVTFLKNGSEIISWNVPEVPTASVNIALDRSFEYDSVWVQPYRAIGAETIVSGSISKVMANVPEWLTGWDTNKVQIGSEYMISPKLFTGVNTGTAEKPILTGIVQGDKCITIDDVERSGIFALAENEIIFALDAKDGSGSLAKGTTYWDKFGQTYRKTREIIVWRRLAEEIQAIRDEIENPEDYPDEYDLNLEYGTYLIAHSGDMGMDLYVNLPDPAECPGLIIDVYDMPRTRVLLYWAKFRCKISPILKANAAGVYEPVVVDDPGRMKFGSSAIRSEKYNDVYRWIADSDFVTVNV